MNTNKKVSLELYYFESCPYCQRVLGCLEELNKKNEVTFIDIKKDPQAKEKLFQETGRYTVPCLYIEGRPMHESLEIVRWLKTHFSNGV